MVPQRWRVIEGSHQAIATGAASASSAAVGLSTYAVMLTASANCHIKFGVAPVAVAGDFLLKASDPPLIIGISPGEKVAVIEDSAVGTLYLIELTA